MLKTLLITVFIIVFGTSCAKKNDIEVLKKLHKNHKVRDAKTWDGWKERALTDRITTAPKSVIEYIGLDNKIYGYEGVPKQAREDKDFRKDFLSAFEELPKVLKEQLKKDLIGVFFVDDLGSSGFTEYVYKDGKYFGGFIIFDQGILSKLKANEWASWRLNSAFKGSDDHRLSLKIADKEQNNRKNAIQFILLHEIGHIIGLATSSHPKEWDIDPKKYPYSKISWNSFKESIYDKEFKNRKDFKIYRFDKAKLGVKDSKDMIGDLSQTDFCSLYGSNTFFEDFAECYTIYVHTKLLNKPYELSLTYKDKELISFKDPFSKEALKVKKEYFEDILK